MPHKFRKHRVSCSSSFHAHCDFVTAAATLHAHAGGWMLSLESRYRAKRALARLIFSNDSPCPTHQTCTTTIYFKRASASPHAPPAPATAAAVHAYALAAQNTCKTQRDQGETHKMRLLDVVTDARTQQPKIGKNTQSRRTTECGKQQRTGVAASQAHGTNLA
jgi:hypothetical protein